MTRDETYQQIAEEIKARRFNKGLMARAISESFGDEKKALSTYIQLRFEEITTLKGDAKVSEGFFTFEVPRKPFGRTRLDIDREKITFGNQAIYCSDAEWIKIGALTVTTNFVRSGTYYLFEVSDNTSTISINVGDVFYMNTKRKLFDEIQTALMEMLVPVILNKLIVSISKEAGFRVGDIFCTKYGAVLPKYGRLFRDGEELVSWPNVKLSTGNGLVFLSHKENKKVFGSSELRKAKNAFMLIPLHNWLVKEGNYRKL